MANEPRIAPLHARHPYLEAIVLKRAAVNPNPPLARQTVIAFFAILMLWTLAWIVKTSFFDKHEWFLSAFGSFLYWSACKITIWIGPCFFLLRISKRKFRDVLKVRSFKWLTWGLMIGFPLAAANMAYSIVLRQNVLPSELLSFASLNAFVLSPFLEELLFRGVILENLKMDMPFWLSNIIASLFFLLIHIPGWFFMGTLQANITGFVGIFIFLLGLVFGLGSKKGESVWSGVIIHIMNNIT